MNQKGLTLIEMMITLTILGIMLASASGMATSYISSTELRSTVNEFRTGLEAAKLEAVKRNSAITFTPNSAGGWAIDIPTADAEYGNIVHLQSKATSSSNIHVATVDSAGTSVTAIRFMWSGRPSADTNNSPVFPVTFSFSVAGHACNLDSSTFCLKVIITSAGQIKTCNPGLRGNYGCSLQKQ